MNLSFLAKSNGTTLQDHISDVLQAVVAIQKIYKQEYPEEWWTALRYAALLHDLGKIDPAFQKKLEERKVTQSLPHSILSIFLIQPDNLPFTGDQKEIRQIILSAVAFHHWR
ncbi:MAG TPA: CRISPR-associated endonuclease Cas3'', partial [Syntrophomonas sp.]|nr:CRISPR-associated endonuclease Cas3'' [Syntrophomonas sp.]